MTSYADYPKQIAQLKDLAEQSRKNEIAQTCEKIRAIMDEHDIKLADLSHALKTAS